MGNLVSQRFIFITTFVTLVLSIAGYIILNNHLFLFLFTTAVSLFVFITEVISGIGEGRKNRDNQSFKNGSAFRMVILLLIIALIGFIGIEYFGSDRFYAIVLILAIAINSFLAIFFVIQNYYSKKQ